MAPSPELPLAMWGFCCAALLEMLLKQHMVTSQVCPTVRMWQQRLQLGLCLATEPSPPCTTLSAAQCRINLSY